MVKKTYWESVQDVTKDWPEDGPIPREEVLALWRWDYLKVNLLEDQGLAWRGESFLNRGWAVLMVVRVARDGIPLVGFITEKNTTACVRILVDKLESGTITWQNDKFA